MEKSALGWSWKSKWVALCLLPVLVGLVIYAGGRLGRWFGLGRGAGDAVARGQALLKQGKNRQALAIVSGVREDGPWKAELLAVKGLALSALGQIEASRQALEQSLKLQPAQPMVAKVLAAIYFSRSESVQGIEYLQKAAKIDPGDFRPWYAIGEAFVRLGQLNEAATAFQRALDRKRDHFDSKIGLASVLVVTKPPEESAHLLGELLQTRPDDPKVQVLAAWHERALGHSDSAFRYIDKAVELAPDLVEAVAFRAQLYRAAGKNGQALTDAERAVELDPNSLPGLNLLAQLQSALGQTERSKATFVRHRQVLERSERLQKLAAEILERPCDPELRWKLGRVAAEGGKNHLASQSYQAALALDPNCQPAIQGLRALGASGDDGGASLSQAQSLLPMINP
jgi:tetratricopeptide (TPR) repeat protein